MARALRIEFEDASYHICARGNARGEIFRTETSQRICQLMSTMRSGPGLASQPTHVFITLTSLLGPMLFKMVTAATVP